MRKESRRSANLSEGIVRTVSLNDIIGAGQLEETSEDTKSSEDLFEQIQLISEGTKRNDAEQKVEPTNFKQITKEKDKQCLKGLGVMGQNEQHSPEEEVIREIDRESTESEGSSADNHKDTVKIQAPNPLYFKKLKKGFEEEKEKKQLNKQHKQHKHTSAPMQLSGQDSAYFFQPLQEFGNTLTRLSTPRIQPGRNEGNLDELNSSNQFLNPRATTRVINSEKIGLDKEEAKAARIVVGDEITFRFEFKEAGFLNYQLYRNKYANNKIYSNSVIKNRLSIISSTIENYIITRRGNGKLLGWASYGCSLLSFAASSVIQNQIKNKLCPDSLGKDKQEKCEENIRTLALLTSVYTALFFFSITTYNYGKSRLETAEYYDKLYDHYTHVLHTLGFNTQDQITQQQINNKRDFADYICMKFWEEFIIAQGYENNVQAFFRKRGADKVVDVHLNIKIAIYEYLSKVHEKWHNEEELQKLLYSYKGQEMAETIVDTLVKGYASDKKFRDFDSIFKIDELLRLLESVLRCEVLPKGELVSVNLIEHASLNYSASIADPSTLFSKDPVLSQRQIIPSEQKQKIAPVMQKFLKKNRVVTNSICSRGNTSLSNATATPISIGQIPPQLPIISELEEEIIDFSNPETLPLENTLGFEMQKEGRSQSSPEVRIEEGGNNDIIIEEEDSELIFANSTLKYLRDCFANTTRAKGAINSINNILNHIFQDSDEVKKELISNIDLEGINKQIVEAIQKRSVGKHVLWLKGAEVLQSFFGSIPFVTLAESESLPVYGKLLVNIASVVVTALLQIPKNGLEKEKSYVENLFEKFDESIRKMLHSWLINVNEDTNEYVPDINLMHMQLICITTSAIVALHNNKYSQTNRMEINSYDLAYLNMQLLYSFSLMYNEKGRFQLQEMPQVQFIVSSLYKELHNKFQYGFINWARARNRRDLSVAQGISSEAICLILKKSIFYSSASPELVHLENIVKVQLIKSEKADKKTTAYIHTMVLGVYDYKISKGITRLDDNAIKFCAGGLRVYYKKNHPKIVSSEEIDSDKEKSGKQEKLDDEKTGTMPSVSYSPNNKYKQDNKNKLLIRTEIRELCVKLEPTWTILDGKLENSLDTEELIANILNKRDISRSISSSEEEGHLKGML